MSNQNNTESGREICPTCGHIVAKQLRRGLSTVEFRRIMGRIGSLEDLNRSKNRLISIIKTVSQNRDFTDSFTVNLIALLDVETDVDIIKQWLSEQIDIFSNDRGVKTLYHYLKTNYPHGINEPFATFYNKYADSYSQDVTIMNKNSASRALNAIGLKSKMSRVEVEDFPGIKRFKSAMFIRATEEELREIFRRVGMVYPSG